jgi:hypothetical protein
MKLQRIQLRCSEGWCMPLYPVKADRTSAGRPTTPG